MNIKAVAFDLGGVLVTLKVRELTQNFADTQEEADILLLDLIRHPDWLEWDRGNFSTQKMAERLFERKNYPIEKTLDFFQYFKGTLKIVKKTEDFIYKLKDSGVEVYFLSNINNETYGYLTEHFEIFKQFKEGVVSECVGVVKPEKAIYDVFLNMSKLEPKEFIFVDDTQVNIDKAKELGWNALIYNEDIIDTVQKEIWNMIKN